MKKLITTFLLLLSSLNAQEIYATFDVMPYKSANLAFTASGLVEKVSVQTGSFVHKGDTLAVLDNKETKALLDRSQTALKFAKKDLQRNMAVKNLIDEGKFDLISKNYEIARNTFAYQKAMYEKTFLKAPFEGVITFKDVEVGDAVSGMMLKTVFKIQSKTKRKLLVRYDQKYAGIVKVGDIYKFKIDSQNKVYTAKITKIYPASDIKTRKMTAEVLTENFVVGLFGSGTIFTQSGK